MFDHRGLHVREQSGAEGEVEGRNLYGVVRVLSSLPGLHILEGKGQEERPAVAQV